MQLLCVPFVGQPKGPECPPEAPCTSQDLVGTLNPLRGMPFVDLEDDVLPVHANINVALAIHQPCLMELQALGALLADEHLSRLSLGMAFSNT